MRQRESIVGHKFCAPYTSTCLLTSERAKKGLKVYTTFNQIYFYANNTSLRTLVSILLPWNLRSCGIFSLLLRTLLLNAISRTASSHPMPLRQRQRLHRRHQNSQLRILREWPRPNRRCTCKTWDPRTIQSCTEVCLSISLFVSLARPAATSHILESGCSG